MKAVTALLAEAALMLFLSLVSNVYAQDVNAKQDKQDKNVNDITITEKSFGCVLEAGGTKIRNTYIRHNNPEKLKEAVRIFKDNVPETDYPVGTILQLFPDQAMVKHPAEKFPLTNGWEFFELQIGADHTLIRARGDRVSNSNSVPCLACHQYAVKFDFVCGKGHGCAPLSQSDKKIAEVQAADPRCSKK